MRTRLAALTFALALSACGSGVPNLPPPTEAEASSVAAADNAFAFDLYARLRARPGNFAMSPVSITSALTMCLAGARGETEAQMRKVLHVEGSVPAAVEAAGKVTANLQRSKKITLSIQNRLFGEKSVRFEPPYVDLLKRSFGAQVESLDFAGAPGPSRERVNRWAAEATHDRIKEILGPDAITAETRLVVANAVYFYGDWEAPFQKSATQPAPFKVSATESREVPLMFQAGHFGFAASEGMKVLELPYAGGEASLLLVLPDAVDGLGAIEARLSPERLRSWTAALHVVEVKVWVPRFEIDPPALSLARPLGELGMPAALDPDQADLTGIARLGGQERLTVTGVFHKAFVKLDEKGTEAAAVTAVAAAATASVEPEPVEFRADHPFLFFLRDRKSGLVLFMGRIADASAK
jgi:serpin B